MTAVTTAFEIQRQSSAHLPAVPRKFIIGIVLLTLVVFNSFAVLRMQPENAAIEENTSHRFGDLDRRVDRLMRKGTAQANRDFWTVADHALFFGRNPGLFIFVVELGVRAGVTSPIPLQLFALFLYNVGLIACFAWIRRMLANELIAALSLVFLATTPYLLFHSTSIHADPYDFCFFNLSMYAFFRFLQGRQRGWYIATWVSYFLLCSSYYMFYISSFIMFAGMQWYVNGRIHIRQLAGLALAPITAFALTFLQAVLNAGGLSQGVHALLDILAVRTIDTRIEGSTWSPTTKAMTSQAWKSYPMTVQARVAAYFFAGWIEYLGVLVLSAAIAPWYRKKVYVFFFFVVAAGLSWNAIMIQHTNHHGFAGMYGFFCWMLIALMAIMEMWLFVWRRPRKVWRAALVSVGLWVFLVAWYSSTRTFLVRRLSTYARNTIRTLHAPPPEVIPPSNFNDL